jgi:hypothetical protein
MLSHAARRGGGYSISTQQQHFWRSVIKWRNMADMNNQPTNRFSLPVFSGFVLACLFSEINLLLQQNDAHLYLAFRFCMHLLYVNACSWIFPGPAGSTKMAQWEMGRKYV